MLLAGRFTLLEQGALDNFLPLCLARGVAIVPGGRCNSGILAHGVKGGGTLHYKRKPAPQDAIDRVRMIEDICDAHGMPMAAAASQSRWRIRRWHR